MLWLFHDGEPVDRYNSSPGYFDDGPRRSPSGGDARLMCALFHAGDYVDDVERILRRSRDHYFDQSDRLRDLTRALDVPEFIVYFGFDYLDRGELPAGLTAADLVRTP
jgi:hypothetical protein